MSLSLPPSLSSALAYAKENTIVIGTAAVVGLVSLSYLTIQYKKRRCREQCPIPMTCPERCHFILGHASVFEGNKIDGLKLLTVDNADEDGLSCFFLFDRMAIGITKVEHLKEIYQATNQRLPNPSTDRHVAKLVGEKSLLLATGDEWKVNRHIISKAFRWEYLQEMVSTMNEYGALLAAVLAKNSGQMIDIFPLMKQSTLDVIGDTAFGYKFNSLQSHLNEMSQQNLSIRLADAFQFVTEEFKRRQFDEPLNPGAQLYWLPTAANRKFASSMKLWYDTLNDIIRNRREEIATGKKSKSEFKDMLNQLLDAHDDESNQVMDDQTLTDNLITLLFAGFDTSSIALTYLFYITAKYPDIEAKCLDEIFAVLGSDGVPSYQDLMANLPYCNAVLMETLRLFPSVPITTRSVVKDFTFSAESTSKKVTIPAGTRILIPIWFVNRSPLNFDRPEEFIPERFLPANAEKLNRYAHIPFSAGARDCIGRRFASLEMLSFFVVVLRKIRFRLRDPAYVPKVVTVGLVQGPVGGMPLLVEKRA